MIPKVIDEPYNLSLNFFGSMAWYNPETNTIHIVKGLKPRWLVILHELGHWLISYFPEFLHRRFAIDFWYDFYWERLGVDVVLCVNMKNDQLRDGKEDAV